MRLLSLLVTSLCLALVVLVLEPSPAADPADQETKRIESLIAHVEGLKDVKFVRNDVEYDAKAAGKFLRGKWDANKAKIKTAQDFIEQAASVSSTTGKPYLIRFKDGKEIKSGEYLKEQLK